MRVEYHPAVEAELNEIRRYYEERSPGLGAQFIDEFERQVLTLAATPERWMVVAGDLRRCLLQRFPYVIYSTPVNAPTASSFQVEHPYRRVPEQRR